MKSNKKKVEERKVKVSSQVCLFMEWRRSFLTNLVLCVQLALHCTKCINAMRLKAKNENKKITFQMTFVLHRG